MAANIQAPATATWIGALCCARTTNALLHVALQSGIGADVAIFVAGPCPFPLVDIVAGGRKIGGVFFSAVYCETNGSMRAERRRFDSHEGRKGANHEIWINSLSLIGPEFEPKERDHGSNSEEMMKSVCASVNTDGESCGGIDPGRSGGQPKSQRGGPR